MRLHWARSLALISLVLVASRSAAAQTCPAPATLTEGRRLPMAAVRYLADDALDGRLAGSPGERCAGDYIAGEFARLNLQPAGERGTFFQDVPLASVLNPHAPPGTGRNVLALLEGSDPTLKNDVIVIGAHYDHLGEGGPSSLAPGVKAIHNGADDNASGVAAMLRAAEQLSAGTRPARSVLFAAFTGEESGLLGSAYLVGHPTATGRLAGMINLDMVGRLGSGSLIVSGVDTAGEWRTVVDRAAARAGVPIATRGEGYGPSDHTSFYVKDVPVLHFFTNTHADYHKPSDDWEKIDAAGLAKVADLVTLVASAIADRGQALTLRRGAGQPPPPPGSTGSGYGAYLGTVPDFTPVDRGVKLSGVTAGSPADKGGIRSGDVVVAIAGKDIADLQAMTDALRAHKPGETVTVSVLRDGVARVVTVTLGDRATLRQ